MFNLIIIYYILLLLLNHNSNVNLNWQREKHSYKGPFKYMCIITPFGQFKTAFLSFSFFNRFFRRLLKVVIAYVFNPPTPLPKGRNNIFEWPLKKSGIQYIWSIKKNRSGFVQFEVIWPTLGPNLIPLPLNLKIAKTCLNINKSHVILLTLLPCVK